MNRVIDPYSLFKINVETAFIEKRPVTGTVVAVMDLMLPERSLNLIAQHSRVLKKREIHELILVTDPLAKPGSVVRGASYLCFFEVTEGGVVLVNDKVIINDTPICVIKGYDETHAPNHINIVCFGSDTKTGKQLGLKVGDKVTILRQ